MSTSPRAIFADGSVLLCSIVSLVQSLDFLLELFSNAVDFLLVSRHMEGIVTLRDVLSDQN